MPSACSAADDRGAEPRDVLGRLRQRAIADDRVLRVRVDVEHRRVVERDADRPQLGGERAREPLGQRDVAAAAERRHRRPLGERRLQPRDAAALLIDAAPTSGRSGTSRDASNASSATCSGSSMLRAKRMTPPRPNSRASDSQFDRELRARRSRRSAAGRSGGGARLATCAPTILQLIDQRIIRRRDASSPSSAPTRIDLAGGTIDIWPLYLFHDGASTLNAAISLRAHVDDRAARPTARIELRSIDTDRDGRRAPTGRELDGDGELPLLALLARHYRLENATLTTRGESPAGAGIAGSSALTIAVCGALARWTGASVRSGAPAAGRDERRVPDDPRADRRAGLSAGALRRHRRHRARRRRRPPRRRSTSIRASSSSASSSPTPARRATPARTTGRSPSATSTAIAHIFDCFERIRDTAVGDARRRSSAATGTRSAGRSPIEWDNRKRLAPGVTTPAIDDLIARATAAGATAAKVCGAGGGGCLFCYGPPARAAGDRRRARAPAARGCSTTASRPKACGLDNAAIARILGRSPTSSRSRARTRSRSARTATAPTSSPTIRTSSSPLDEAGLREIPGIGKDLAARIREIAETGDAAFHRELLAEFPPTILDLLHLQGVGPKTVATLYRELGIRTLDDLERAARDGRDSRAAAAWARRRKR